MRVTLDNLVIDPEVQARVDGIDAAHVAQLEEAEELPPIKVTERAGVLVLLDGNHRLEAARNLGIPEIDAEVVGIPPDGDLRGEAFRLNALHGLPLTLNDRRAECARQLSMHPEFSDRRIAEHSGLAQATVARIRADLEAGAQIEHLESRIGTDGKSYGYRPRTGRQVGELPPEGFVETVSQLFSTKDRRRQRETCSFLRRVLVALEDGYELVGDVDEVVVATRLTLGEEKSLHLGERLKEAAEPIVAIARALVGE